MAGQYADDDSIPEEGLFDWIWIYDPQADPESEALRATVFLLSGYGIALALIVLYFMCEDWSFHWSQRVECAYLNMVLGIIFVASTGWQYFYDVMEIPLRQMASVQCFQLIFLLVTLHLAFRYGTSSVHTRFYSDLAGARVPAKKRKPAATPYSEGVAKIMDELIHKILEIQAGKWAMGFLDGALSPIILVLLMLQEMSWCVRVQVLMALVLVMNVGLQLIIIIYGIHQAVVRWRSIGPLVARLNKLVTALVDGADDGDIESLRYVLATVNVASLMELAKDSVTELTQRALSLEVYDTISKAVLVDALQQKGIRSRRDQAAVRRLILSCCGNDLTLLKNLVDGGGDYNNLYKLVYTDISKQDMRAEVLEHLREEGFAVRSELKQRAGVKVLSDIDDTLYSSGGKFPAGCDMKFPKPIVYPGCLSLFRVLDRSWRETDTSVNLVFLSARPHVYKSLAEDRSYQRLKTLVDEGRMHSYPTLLPGRFVRGIQALGRCACMTNRGWKPVGNYKFQTYLKFKRLYPEYDFVFFGDNGQGDLLAGEKMVNAEHKEHLSCGIDSLSDAESTAEQSPNSISSSRLLGVFIHKVASTKSALAETPPSRRGGIWRDRLQRWRLFFHRTYVGAAVDLHCCDPALVSADEVWTIAKDAIHDFELAKKQNPWWDSWQAAESDLWKDLARAQEVVSLAKGTAFSFSTPSPGREDSDVLVTGPSEDHFEASSSEDETDLDGDEEQGCDRLVDWLDRSL